MSHRALWALAAALLAGIAILSARSCQSPVPPTPPTTAMPANASAAQDPAQAQTRSDAAREALAERRTQAIWDAVDTLQRYLGALASGDFAKADGFWIDGRPADSSDEADLRHLGEPRALRIQNRTPKALDSEPVPEAIEIPVELRLVSGGTTKRYRGWYRLRSSNPAAGGWKITSASVARESR